MKRPIIDQWDRFIIIHHPNSMSAAWANKNIAVAHFRRDLENALDEVLRKITQSLNDALETLFNQKP